MSGQRARPAVSADHRSAHPNIPGVPWWGAVLIAVLTSMVGFAFDAGSGGGELTAVFATSYVFGCVAAVLAVRQSAVFTAVIQPPLILFVVVPGAYFLMHSSSIEGIKDVLINCGYPLIERFPLMFFTSAAVLLIGAARWYFGSSAKSANATGDKRDSRGSRVRSGRIAAMITGLIGGRASAKATTAGETRKRDRPARRRAEATPSASGRPSRERRDGQAARRSASPSRRARVPENEIIEPVADRPRRRRPRPTEAPPTGEPRRRSRGSAQRDPRTGGTDGRRRMPADTERAPRPQRRAQRPTRYDDVDYPGYDPMELFGQNDGGTHHPISRVRYRGADDVDDRTEHRGRRPRDYGADRWEYDI